MTWLRMMETKRPRRDWRRPGLADWLEPTCPILSPVSAVVLHPAVAAHIARTARRSYEAALVRNLAGIRLRSGPALDVGRPPARRGQATAGRASCRTTERDMQPREMPPPLPTAHLAHAARSLHVRGGTVSTVVRAASRLRACATNAHVSAVAVGSSRAFRSRATATGADATLIYAGSTGSRSTSTTPCLLPSRGDARRAGAPPRSRTAAVLLPATDWDRKSRWMSITTTRPGRSGGYSATGATGATGASEYSRTAPSASDWRRHTWSAPPSPAGGAP